MYNKYGEHVGVENTSSLVGVPDYRGFSLERFTCSNTSSSSASYSIAWEILHGLLLS